MNEITQAASATAEQPRSRVRGKTPVMSAMIVVSVLACIPLVWRDEYVISLLTLIMVYSLMAQSWNLTGGVFEIWNLGQMAIIAIGGYVTGIATVTLGLSPWLALPAGAVAGGLAALIFVLPVIRLRGVYAAVLTFALAEVVRRLIVADHSGFTGGLFGLSGVKGLFDGLSAYWSLRAYFWLTLVLSAAVMLLVDRLVSSPRGLSSERRWAVAVAILVSGLVGGLAGGLYATFYHGITPSFIGLVPLGLLVTMVIVGGLGTARGPILGAFAVTIVGELLRDAAVWRLAALGALMLLVLTFWPTGIDGLLQRSIKKTRAWMKLARGDDDAEGPSSGPGPTAASRPLAR
jgi:branched-chain amino acid transport system permease protein